MNRNSGKWARATGRHVFEPEARTLELHAGPSIVIERQCRARSASRPAWESLVDAANGGEVLAVFRRSLVLEFKPGSATDKTAATVLALVLPEIGDGPLNIVLDEQVDTLNGFRSGQSACFRRGELHVGKTCILLDRASIWEPRPDWSKLRSKPGEVTGALELALSPARSKTSSTSILELIDPSVYPGAIRPTVREFLDAARRGMEALEVGLKGEPGALHAGVAQLAGLGPGLTPAGDDFLSGVMLCLWLRHPDPLAVCRSISQVAVPRTTLLSGAMLQRAAAGECDADWHHLFHSVANGDRKRSGVAAGRILARGNTSGSDSVAGFLWMNRLRQTLHSTQRGRLHSDQGLT